MWPRSAKNAPEIFKGSKLRLAGRSALCLRKFDNSRALFSATRARLRPNSAGSGMTYSRSGSDLAFVSADMFSVGFDCWRADYGGRGARAKEANLLRPRLEIPGRLRRFVYAAPPDLGGRFGQSPGTDRERSRETFAVRRNAYARAPGVRQRVQGGR